MLRLKRNRSALIIVLLVLLGIFTSECLYIYKVINPTPKRVYSENIPVYPPKIMENNESAPSKLLDYAYGKDPISGILDKEIDFPETPIVNPVTKDEITFRRLNGEEYQMDGQSYFDVYINGERISMVNGLTISMGTFSPDNRYFSFRSRYEYGAGSRGFIIYVIDLKETEVIRLTEAMRRKDYISDEHSRAWKITQFIESCEWEGNNTLKLVAYLMASEGDKQENYRITAKATKYYDLVDNEYIPMGSIYKISSDDTRAVRAIKKTAPVWYFFDNGDRKDREPILIVYDDIIIKDLKTDSEIKRFDVYELIAPEVINKIKGYLAGQYYFRIKSLGWSPDDTEILGEVYLFPSADPPKAILVSGFKINTDSFQVEKYLVNQ